MSECECCGGTRYYPIIDTYGTERFRIECPNCYGSGEEPEEENDELAADGAELPPESSAASIQTLDGMREHVARHWSGKAMS
jgi:hypothetical protein